MTDRQRTRPGPCPARIRRQIASGGDIDYPALLDWWERRCPAWLTDAGLSPIAAAVLSVMPEAKMRDAPGRLRFTIAPTA